MNSLGDFGGDVFVQPDGDMMTTHSNLKPGARRSHTAGLNPADYPLKKNFEMYHNPYLVSGPLGKAGFHPPAAEITKSPHPEIEIPHP